MQTRLRLALATGAGLALIGGPGLALAATPSPVAPTASTPAAPTPFATVAPSAQPTAPGGGIAVPAGNADVRPDGGGSADLAALLAVTGGVLVVGGSTVAIRARR